MKSEIKICLKHGEYESWQKATGFTPCETCANEQKLREKRISRLQHAGIPMRFLEATFESYHATTEAQQYALTVARSYAEEFRSHRRAGRCMVMVGRVGTGKTHLALAIAQHVIEAGFRTRYASVCDVISEIRATWRNDAPETEAGVLHRYTACDLLVLDEVGVQYGTESEQLELFKVFNKRYNDVRPTIVLSNVTTEELKGYLGERVFDRLRENEAKVIQFDWESERGKRTRPGSVVEEHDLPRGLDVR